MMTTDLALTYIQKRACELCYGNDYTIRVRHLVLQPLETRPINSHNQFFVLIEPYCELRIESGSALFDISDDQSNELQYEHRGDIIVTNQSIFINHVRFIQVIPKICNKPCP
jgi:hypothetical protein